MEFAKLVQKKSILFCDNYYGSYKLASSLLEKEFNFVLCFRENRPTYIFKEGLHKELVEKGDSSSRYSPDGKLRAFSLWDKKKVNFLSDCFNNIGFEFVRNGKNRGKKAKIIHMYNTGMSGVDLADSFLHYCPLFSHRKNK